MQERQCAQCHRKIDPVGYGLENFDAAGQWRDVEVSSMQVSKRQTRTKRHVIDSSGALPDGSQFDDYYQLRDRVAEREDLFALGFTEALIEYGLGRPFGFTDYPLSEEIVKAAKSDNNRIRAFIHTLVQSEPFHTK